MTVTSFRDLPHGWRGVAQPTMRPVSSSLAPLPLITVRNLGHSDLPDVVRIDAEAGGRRRAEYFELMLMRALNFAGLQISLVAEIDGRIVGYLIASLFYGEYGIGEPTASIEAIAVAADVRRSGVAHEMMEQFRAGAAAIGVSLIRTEVPSGDLDLFAFFKDEKFAPAQRVCLERKVT